MLYRSLNAQVVESPTVGFTADSVDLRALTITGDTLPLGDSSAVSERRIVKKLSSGALKDRVTYEASDSIVIDIQRKMAYLFGKAVVYYDDIELHADYIEIGFVSQELYATGVADSNGIIHGEPLFKQGETFFRAQEIKYNFQTTKGIITNVISVEGEGYIHGEKVKKLEDNTTFIKHGKYTTCELDHPHFEISFSRAKVIPDDKIVMGPAYLNFGGIPTPLAIPFGYFPLKKGRSSGIVIPTIGESSNRGFYMENFGYYFGISDNLDLLIGGDLYTNGSWAAKVRSNYVYRYKCSGKVDVSFAQNFFGEKYTPSRYNTNDFKLYWSHKQDAKSNPTTRFSALINIVSRTYNTYNSSSVNDYLSNQYTSKLNLSTNAKNIFFADITASYTQNTKTGQVDLLLPDLSMSVNQFYPFRRKNRVKNHWYDNISMKWTSQFTDRISTTDSLLLKPETWQNMHLGMKHTIPITIPIKIAKLINWNTSVSLTEKWYLQREVQSLIAETDSLGNTSYNISRDLQRNFYALHDLSMSTNLTTKVYFMYQFKKGKLQAIRHVMTPTLSFTYTPNISGNTYGEYYNPNGDVVNYSYYANAIFGGVNNRTTAIARLSIANNLEMKVRSRRDTITGTKKVVLIENLSVNCYYDFAADSLNWSMLTLSGRTTLFKQLYITFNIGFDPYCYNEKGVRIHKTEWEANRRLFRFSSTNVNVGLNWTLNPDYFKGKQSKKKTEESITDNALGINSQRPDFSNPWSITLNYTFAYSANDNRYYYMDPRYLPANLSSGSTEKKYDSKIIQTFNISGDINVTKKWKIGFTTGYDFTQKDMSYTSLDIYRDLHCWEMRFNWVPFGTRKGWSFTINVKASALHDLKYNMKRDFRENF